MAVWRLIRWKGREGMSGEDRFELTVTFRGRLQKRHHVENAVIEAMSYGIMFF